MATRKSRNQDGAGAGSVITQSSKIKEIRTHLKEAEDGLDDLMEAAAKSEVNTIKSYKGQVGYLRKALAELMESDEGGREDEGVA